MFHLITSDGASIAIDKSILSVHSSVFRGMLQVARPKAGEQKEECAVTERDQ
jgi:hypothetical protein